MGAVYKTGKVFCKIGDRRKLTRHGPRVDLFKLIAHRVRVIEKIRHQRVFRSLAVQKAFS